MKVRRAIWLASVRQLAVFAENGFGRLVERHHYGTTVFLDGLDRDGLINLRILLVVEVLVAQERRQIIQHPLVGLAHIEAAEFRPFAVTTPRKSDRRELILVHVQNPVFGQRNTL